MEQFFAPLGMHPIFYVLNLSAVLAIGALQLWNRYKADKNRVSDRVVKEQSELIELLEKKLESLDSSFKDLEDNMAQTNEKLDNYIKENQRLINIIQERDPDAVAYRAEAREAIAKIDEMYAAFIIERERKAKRANKRATRTVV